jgi:hypothetical protein
MIDGFRNITPLLGSGVYLLVYKGRIQYIGRTACFLQRLGIHHSDRKIPFDSVYVMLCSNAEEKEYELILKHKPKYNKETGITRLVRTKSPEMYKIGQRHAEVGKRHAEEEMAKLITEIEGKKEVDDIITVFKRRL